MNVSKCRSRATTRWQLGRAKSKALSVAKIAHFKGAHEGRSETERAEKDLALHFYRNRQPCSCPLCGNTRRSKLSSGKDRTTIQERLVPLLKKDPNIQLTTADGEISIKHALFEAKCGQMTKLRLASMLSVESEVQAAVADLTKDRRAVEER